MPRSFLNSPTSPLLALLWAALVSLVPAWGQSPVLPLPGQGRTFYVSTNGNDAWEGSLIRPWRNIQTGIDRANFPGDTVYVRSGLYLLRRSLRLRHDGSPSAGRITLASYPLDPDRAVLRGSDLSPQAVSMVDLSGRRYVSFEGFDLRGFEQGERESAAILLLGSGQGVRISGNLVHEMGSALGDQGSCRALLVATTGNGLIQDVSIADNEFFDVHAGQAPVVEIAGRVQGFLLDTNLIEGNLCDEVVAIRHATDQSLAFNGISIDGAPPTGGLLKANTIRGHDDPLRGGIAVQIAGAQAITLLGNDLASNQIGLEVIAPFADQITAAVRLESNFIAGNSKVGVAIGGLPEDSSGQVEGLELISNTLFNNGGGQGHGLEQGSLRLGEARDVRVFGNLIVAASQGPAFDLVLDLVEGGSIQELTLAKNLYWTTSGQPPRFELVPGLALPGLAVWQSVTGQDSFSLQVDPQLQFPFAGDLRLLPGSPAIDAASGQSGQFADFDYFGTPRPQGLLPDIGAHEWKP